MAIDLSQFSGSLPYASELFGIYQPLLGWKSKRTAGILVRQQRQLVTAVLSQVLKGTPSRESLRRAPHPVIPTDLQPNGQPAWIRTDTGQELRKRAIDFYKQHQRAPQGPEWQQLVKQSNFDQIIAKLAKEETAPLQARLSVHTIRDEAAIAGTIAYLAKESPQTLSQLLPLHNNVAELLLANADPLSQYDPAVQQAVLSPIGLIQIFREYFFEFDSFLGPPVGHAWVSPGGSLELFEIHTRRSTQDRLVEVATETTTRSEREVVDEDELSTAIAEQNARNTSIGVSASVGGSLFGIVQASASASFGMQFNTQSAQQESHRHSRAQSEKLSDEIRRNFKTTFRTTVETTDSSSRRYVLQNTTDKLVNYELRRKMRQVGVQVQHIGTQLCWQFYVDYPGMMLGLGELVHVAQPADLDPAPAPPEAPAKLQPKTSTYSFLFPFDPVDDAARDDGEDEEYHDGFDIQSGQNPGHIRYEMTVEAPPPEQGYTLNSAEVASFDRVDADEDPPAPVATETQVVTGTNSFKITLHEVNFNDQPAIRFTVNLIWDPPGIDAAVQQAYNEKKKAYDAAQQKATHAAYVKAVRERIKLASNVKPRPPVDLREEERTMIYRRLLQELTGIKNGPEPHLLSELIRAIFDIDKMLYFVAPDWWSPKTFTFKQQLGKKVKVTLTSDDIIGWGGTGAQAMYRPNYKITEESEPARMGSSVGWLQQLDGDTHRNAFLNSPWVKAVMPIRPGRESAAINWLKRAHVEGTDNLDAKYSGNEPGLSGKTIEEAIHILAEDIAEQGTGIQSVLATETVYQNGFDPLETGFAATGTAFEVFDQWVEVLPTDQVVAVDYIAPSPAPPVDG